MLSYDYTKDLLNLQDVIIDKIENLSDTVKIHIGCGHILGLFYVANPRMGQSLILCKPQIGLQNDHII